MLFPLVDVLRSFRVSFGHICAPGRAKVAQTPAVRWIKQAFGSIDADAL